MLGDSKELENYDTSLDFLLQIVIVLHLLLGKR